METNPHPARGDAVTNNEVPFTHHHNDRDVDAPIVATWQLTDGLTLAECLCVECGARRLFVTKSWAVA